MVTNELADDSPLDGYVARVSQVVARRTPRRSFLGIVGRVAMVGAATSTATLLWDEPAFAATCHDGRRACASESALCGCSGSASSSCPSGTCECGCWNACTSHCGGGVFTKFCDCCISSGSCGSSCPCGPRCCFLKEWSGGCTATRIIRCRHFTCVGPRGCA
jgi:hypothetical protein